MSTFYISALSTWTRYDPIVVTRTSARAARSTRTAASEIAANEALERAFTVLAENMRALFMRRLDAADLSPPQFLTLTQLATPAPMREMAARLRCDASNMTGLADRLEERGLLERRADPNDRRVKLLTLTPAGEKLVGEMNRNVIHDLPGLATLSLAEREQLASLIVAVLGLS